MSIFKGDSIYKSGGGSGGGYSDGGALVDGDFIKVENNTVSSYDNVSRDPINLYFEPKDGEILNAIVELTTTVNATVHVYIVQNGLFIPLGNVGGDTVNAGDEYKVNITGDSFAIEQVTSGGADPEAVLIGGDIYPVVKIGGLIWLAQNLDYKFTGLVVGGGTSYNETRANYYNNDEATFGRNGNKYGLLYNWESVKYLNNNRDVIGGWRLPTKLELENLINDVGGPYVAGKKLKATYGWSGNGDGSYNFNAVATGYQISGGFNYLGNENYIWSVDEDSSVYSYSLQFTNSDSASIYLSDKKDGLSIRLVRNY